MSIDITAAVIDLCEQASVKPIDVGRIEIWAPHRVIFSVYKRNADGNIYIDEDGEPAMDRRLFEAKWNGGP